MRIIADAFGGDNAPKAIIEGCAKAAEKFGVDITLVGNEDAIKKCANECGINVSSMEIIHTDGVISMHDDPKDVLKRKPILQCRLVCARWQQARGTHSFQPAAQGRLCSAAHFWSRE